MRLIQVNYKSTLYTFTTTNDFNMERLKNEISQRCKISLMQQRLFTLTNMHKEIISTSAQINSLTNNTIINLENLDHIINKRNNSNIKGSKKTLKDAFANFDIRNFKKVLKKALLTKTKAFYKNQDNLGYLKRNYPEISIGKTQSPIKISSLSSQYKSPNSISLNLKSNTQKITFSPENAFKSYFNFGSIELKQNNKILHYDALQMHIHSPAEHVIDNIKYDAELHLVFKIVDKQEKEVKNTLLVCGFFFKEDDKEKNNFLNDWILNSVRNSKTESFLNMNSLGNLIKSNGGGVIDDYFHYNGSLTTPCCNEIVNWFVFKDAIKCTKEQKNLIFNQFKDFENEHGVSKVNGMGKRFGNNRGTQPIHGRTVYCGNLANY